MFYCIVANGAKINAYNEGKVIEVRLLTLFVIAMAIIISDVEGNFVNLLYDVLDYMANEVPH